MSARFLLRTLHTAQGCLRARAPRRSNPGMAYQLEQLQDHGSDNAASEDYADMESDFMSVHKTHRQHEAELRTQRDRVRQFMIKHKYFRGVKLPSLLLHAEKEQMRLLHARDPQEWSAERLAESFPATPEIVQKVLRAKWRPQNVERIRAHDQAIMKNWSELKSGACKVEIPPAFLQHLQKFADRKPADLQQLATEHWPTRPALPKPQRTEFQSLITSCAKYAQPVEQAQLTAGGDTNSFSGLIPAEANDEETFLLDKVQNKRKMRLQELKKSNLVPDVRSQAVAEQYAAQSLQSPSGTGHLPSFVSKFQSNEITISVADQQRYEMTKLKERIHIPRKLYRKGATYRVEDAYYDDDGELLYRVPGMTGND